MKILSLLPNLSGEPRAAPQPLIRTVTSGKQSDARGNDKPPNITASSLLIHFNGFDH